MTEVAVVSAAMRVSEAEMRVRTQVTNIAGAESRLRGPLLRAPSPPRPLRRSSSSVRIISEHDRDSSGEKREEYRSRSRASDRDRNRSEAEGRRYGRGCPPVDDYDWYDEDGMRVRVREI